MIKTARYIILSLIFAIYYLIFNIAPANAQTYQPNPNLTSNTNPDVPQNLHTWTQTVFIEVLSAGICQIAGIDLTNPNQQCLGVDQKSGKIVFVHPTAASGGGAIGVTSYMIGQLFNPPVHTTDYFTYLGSNFGVAKKAYAQSAGLDQLSPLFNLWTVFRNIVYLAFVVVFVVIGLTIMLRIKIDPRTVMSIENQIPKIIIGIVLVTFSIAIAGLLIDLMYVSMYLIFNTIASVPDTAKNISSLNPALLQGKTTLDLANNLAGDGKLGIADIAKKIADAGKAIFNTSLGVESCPKGFKDFFCLVNDINPLNFVFDLSKSPINIIYDIGSFVVSAVAFFRVMSMQVGTGVPILDGVITIIGKTATAVTVAGTAWATTQLLLREVLPILIIWVIVFVAMLWAMIRLGFELLKAYIFILLDIVLAPFWIVAGLFPGSPIGFGGWLKSIISNLSAFPVTLGMFLLGNVFINEFNKVQGIGFFTPPLVGNPTGGDASPLAALIGIGVILMTPQVVVMMKELLKSPQLKYTAAIGQAVGVGTGAVNLPEHAKSFGMYRYYTGYLRNLPFGVGALLGGEGTQRTKPGGRPQG